MEEYYNIIDVDNHLGYLFSRMPYKFIPKMDIPTIQLNNLLPPSMAKIVRDYTFSIPYDSETPILNNDNNPPKNVIYSTLRPIDMVPFQGSTYQQLLSNKKKKLIKMLKNGCGNTINMEYLELFH